jgi:transcription initiation factor IIF auxiliary subunit
VSLSRAIVYGSIAYPLAASGSGTATGEHTHRWTVYVRTAAAGEDELAPCLKRVQFKLHESFAQPTRSTLEREREGRRGCVSVGVVGNSKRTRLCTAVL